MLTITIPEIEAYDEEKNEFINFKETKITLEHSLKSLAKWEAKWHKPYLSQDKKTVEEMLDYIRCMTLTQNVNPEIYRYIPASEFKRIESYIEDPMTATTVKEDPSAGVSGKNTVLTAEVIYYYMVSYGVWLDWEKRHLNQLLMLLRVCSEKNKPPKQMSKSKIASEYRSLNAARRARLHSKG